MAIKANIPMPSTEMSVDILPLRVVLVSYMFKNWFMSRMTVEQILQKEINESNRCLDLETDESTYKGDLQKRIELLS